MGTGLVSCVGIGFVLGAGVGFVVDTGISNLTLGGRIGFVLEPTLSIGFEVGMGSALRAYSITISLVMLPSRKPFRSLLRRAERTVLRPFVVNILRSLLSLTTRSRRDAPPRREKTDSHFPPPAATLFVSSYIFPSHSIPQKSPSITYVRT